jgi:hypothetical protein
MNTKQTVWHFILLTAVSLAVAAGTNSARAQDTAGTAELTATVIGRGRLSPNYNGKALNINQDYTIRAVPIAGFAFSYWIVAGSTNTFINTTAKLTFQMASNLQLTATFVDIQPPTVTITTKKSTGSNAVVAISGTAKDNVGVAAVWCQVGSSGWNLAATGNAYTNWTAFVILGAGANTIHVYAEDTAGNRSKTNSVTLRNDSTGLAPESLAGTMLQLVATNNQIAALSFGGSTFCQVGSNGVTTGVGNYTYTLNDPDTAQLATAFTAPPTTVSNNSGGDAFILFFTNGTSGTWTNLNANSGAFTLSDASSTVPDSLSGLTLQGTNTGTNVYQFTNAYGDGTFTSTNTTGNSSGTYTFAQYSPEAGLLQESLTDEADLGTTNYLVLSFLTDANPYYIETDTTNGADTNAGTFSVVEGTNTPAYTAPASLAGLLAAVTQVKTNGARKSFMVSFGAGTYGEFASNTNEDSGVGAYAFTRTGTKTALFLNTHLAPPDYVSNGGTEPSSFYFTSSHSANVTNSDGHSTFTFSEPASTVPLSLVGRTIKGSDGGATVFSYGTFSKSKDGVNSTGNYTYAVYGPRVAMVTLNYTDVSDAGLTKYVILWFSSATGGSQATHIYNNGSSNVQIETGSFTMH